jgi:hypothetical protein
VGWGEGREVYLLKGWCSKLALLDRYAVCLRISSKKIKNVKTLTSEPHIKK